ncbi:putative siderochrome-iron transporter [Aspergillus melleus]|uniref:putative siderochrome-iron transporter n=1 Tax=Aspergillus melleus TaxID=138277 RepID=UPI001E8CF388|nr:Siderochrome iron transporter 2 [Aspergillus melleus]KAH8432660.1 Siderochrome iron transporter 2 [Aspergillus melleus]
MGVLELVRGRDNTAMVSDLAGTEDHRPKNSSPENPETSGSESDRKSLEARNEKEIELHPDQVTEGAQLGIQRAEAAALVWSKKALVATYAWIWVSFFMLALQSSISSIAQQTAYAKFQSAPAVSTANILASIIGGVLKLPIAKTLNLWGRAEGLCASVAVYILGIIILAACDGPSSYSAGYVIYWVGYDGIYLILQVFIADTSGLRNRAFAFAFASTPFICTAFTGSLAGQNFVDNTGGWRWAYGAFAIIMPFVFLPLAVVFKYYEKKAVKTGVFNPPKSGRTVTQSIVHYLHQFDVAGALLLMIGWILILLPFSLTSYGRAEYKSATFICMIVFGFVTLLLFAAWEKFVARVHFINYELLKKRTVLGACTNSGLLFFSFYCWDLYFLSFCMVVYNLNQGMAGYMLQIYNVGSCFWGVVIGIWMRFTKEFKWTSLCFGLPLMILGAGLMIKFRGDGGTDDIGYLIMSQIFIAFGGGTLVIGNEMAVMAAADREGVPMMLSVLGLFSSLGGAIGQAVQAAIYNNVFVEALESALPESEKSQAMQISGDGYLIQQTYPLGSDKRNAVNYAWGHSQMFGCIAATCILVLSIPCIAMWKNYRLNKKQNKGTML